jgi:hypothetical protein
MRILLTAILSLMLGGCAVGASGCYTKRKVVVPDASLVRTNISHGQSGRDIADAIIAGDNARALAILQADPKVAGAQVLFDPARSTERPQGQYGDILSLAVSRCDLSLVGELLSAGLSPDGVQKGEALTLALLADGPEMAELLLRAGATVDPQKGGGKNVMHEVTAFGHVGAAMMLLRYGLDAAWEDEFGDGHLQTAVDMEQYRIAELLIEKGANPFRIGGAGNMAAQSFDRPLIIANADNDAARQRLLLRTKKQWEAAGLTWPLPSVALVREKILAGEWPSPAMKAAGVPPLTTTAISSMKKRFGK